MGAGRRGRVTEVVREGKYASYRAGQALNTRLRGCDLVPEVMGSYGRLVSR